MLEHDGIGDPFTRRGLMKRGGAAGAALLLPATVLQACGSDGAEVGGSASAAMFGKYVDLDPAVDSSDGALALIPQVFEPLYGSRPDVRDPIKPLLADGEPEEVTPTQYLVRIRDGATFHDGSRVTAKDFVASMERIQDPKTGAILTAQITILKSARARDEQTVEIDLVKPTPLLKERLALIQVVPAGFTPKKGETYPGTGPFAITKADASSVTLERFVEYNGPEESFLDSVDISIIENDNARVAALESGRVATIDGVPLQSVDRLESSSNADLEMLDGFLQDVVFFNCGKPPFEDVRARQAFFYGIDRDAVNEGALFGRAPTAASYFPEGHPEFVEPETIYTYDPELARSLLKEAGQENISFPLQISSQGWLAGQGELLQEQLSQIGMNVDLKITDTAAGFSTVVDGSYFAYIVPGDATELGAYDGEFLLRWSYYGVLPEQFLYWSGPKYEELKKMLNQAVTATDEATYTGLIQDAQNLVAQEIPSFPMHHRQVGSAWNPNELADYVSLSTNYVNFIGVSQA